jgi:FdhE protein
LSIGEEAKPPFAVLPDPSSLFLLRARRLAALAPSHDLEAYLRFLAALVHAQHDIQGELPPASLPPFEHIGRALEHGMPPVSRTMLEPDAVVDATLSAMLARLGGLDLPPAARAAVDAMRGASQADRSRMVLAALKDVPPAEGELAERALVAAALQVHFARTAALLDADDLKRVADGACPVCGSAPMTTSVVGWPRAHNTRFCTCSLCATMWNVVRVKCVLCGSTAGISYRAVEGKPDTVKAEACDDCHGYVKILYQVNDHALEALADDVASLGLDMLMSEDGWRRGGQNPFLLGY